jgi:hypothetical protein
VAIGPHQEHVQDPHQRNNGRERLPRLAPQILHVVGVGHPDAQPELRAPLPLVVEPAQVLRFLEDDDIPLAAGDELRDVDLLGGEDAELEEVEDGRVEGDAEMDLGR